MAHLQCFYDKYPYSQGNGKTRDLLTSGCHSDGLICIIFIPMNKAQHKKQNEWSFVYVHS